MTDMFQADPLEQPQVTVDPSKEYLPELVGEGKKYKSPEDLAKAALHKDQFIEQLKREQRERDATISRLNEELNTRIKQEDFLTKVETLVTPKLPEGDNQNPERNPGTPAITTDDVQRLLEARDAEKRRQDNLNLTDAKLREVFGDEYKRRVQEQAKALGVTTSYLTGVAAESPAALFRLLGVDRPAPKVEQSAPPRGTVNLPSTPGTVKNKKYFQELRKTIGDAKYFTPAVQQEIWKNAEALGPAWDQN